MQEITEKLQGLDAVSRAQIPILIGQLAEAQARLWLRLLETSAPPSPPTSRVITVDEAAHIAGVSKRWITVATRGLSLRHDLSRKNLRFDEVELRRWLNRRR